jgi:hypothetical protein
MIEFNIGFGMQNIILDKNNKHGLQCFEFLFCILQFDFFLFSK